jgi:biopolymer transport protein ExbB
MTSMRDHGNATHRRWLVWLLTIAVVAATGDSIAWAQQATATGPDRESATEASATESPKEAISYKSLFDIVQDGGVMMFPLLACSFIMLVFVFERVISLRRGRVSPRPFVKRFLHQVREGKLDRDGALEACAENGSAVSTVFAAAARKWGRPSVELEQSIIDGCDRVSGSLRRYIRLFNAVATISPLLGLLGTVFGMIQLFNDISNADAMGRTELLAGGISEALLTTATGLAIAIPSLCFYVMFSAKVERLLMEIDGHSQELVGMISAEAIHDERHGKMRAKSRPTAAA